MGWGPEEIPILGRSCADCNSAGCCRKQSLTGVNNEETEKCLKDRIPFAETLVIDTAALSEWVQPLAAAFRSTVPAGAIMLRALKNQTRKRSVQPQGDTIYRAAAVAAALMVLAAAPFF